LLIDKLKALEEWKYKKEIWNDNKKKVKLPEFDVMGRCKEL
jgi:hypothetical protein